MRLKVYNGNQFQTATDVKETLEWMSWTEEVRASEESILARAGVGSIKDLCSEVGEAAGSDRTGLARRSKGVLKDETQSVKGQGFEDLSFAAKGCWEFSLKWQAFWIYSWLQDVRTLRNTILRVVMYLKSLWSMLRLKLRRPRGKIICLGMCE